MKFLQSIALVTMAVAVSVHTAAQAQTVGSPIGSEAGIPSNELVQSSYLRRSLQANNTATPAPSTTAPTTTAPPPPTTPPPTTPAPTTTAPPATTSPAPTTPAPTTPAPTTPAPTTTAPATTVPATTTPAPSTTTPPPTTAGSGSGAKTPAPTTAAPVTKKPSTGSGVTPSSGGSVDGAGADKSAGSSDGATAASKDSKMSTGTIIGIVCGIVGGVAILAIIAVVLARRRHQEEDDDPLSPFELSMDKGYNGAPGFNNNGNTNNVNGSQYDGTNGGAYSGARTTTNNSAAIGGAALGGGAAAVLASTTTSSGGADAAGVTYTQFYDVPTSPGSMYHQQQLTQRNLSAHTDEAAANNDSNLWMSAMEPKDNDIEGASVPPQVSLPGDEYDDDKHLSFLSRNSYDVAGSESIDIDQSSVLSGGSDLEKEFPDYEDGSSRGSYEL